MKTALIAVHCLSLGIVLMLLGRYALTTDDGLFMKAYAVVAGVWMLVSGFMVWTWIKRTF